MFHFFYTLLVLSFLFLLLLDVYRCYGRLFIRRSVGVKDLYVQENLLVITPEVVRRDVYSGPIVHVS